MLVDHGLPYCGRFFVILVVSLLSTLVVTSYDAACASAALPAYTAQQWCSSCVQTFSLFSFYVSSVGVFRDRPPSGHHRRVYWYIYTHFVPHFEAGKVKHTLLLFPDGVVGITRLEPRAPACCVRLALSPIYLFYS